jgi:hypothetical protein
MAHSSKLTHRKSLLEFKQSLRSEVVGNEKVKKESDLLALARETRRLPRSLKRAVVAAHFAFLALLALPAQSAEAVSDVAGVKTYLVARVEKMKEASADFMANASAYSALMAKNKGDYAQAYKAEGKQIDALVAKMQGNYKAMDSYGYETVEGIVAGIDSLAHYDIYLDAGVPASEGPNDVAEVTLDLGNGEKIDRQGSLFTFIIEPALWAGDARWVKDAGGRKLPRAEVLSAAAKDADFQIAKLLADSKALSPSTADCFGAMIAMTPTLSDYFEDWKESRYSKDKSGRFQAVSRISDMRGIMSSCAVMFDAVEAEVARKDKALAANVQKGFDQIMAFLDEIEAKEKKGDIKLAEIDEMAEQAKSKTDKLVPQIEQAQALTGKRTG